MALAKKRRQRMSKVYEISGKFQENASWSDRLEDFSGVFVVDEETHVLKGYMEEKYPSEHDSLRFIYGIMNGRELAYFKLSNDMWLYPLAYLFTDYNKEGKWLGLELIRNRVIVMGDAKVTLKEISDNSHQCEQEVDKVYSTMKGGIFNFNDSVEDYLPALSDWLHKLS